MQIADQNEMPETFFDEVTDEEDEVWADVIEEN
jgi:hypothetical protein